MPPFLVVGGRPIFVAEEEQRADKPAAGVPTLETGESANVFGIGDGFPGAETPSTFLGGAGALLDYSSDAAGIAVTPNFPSERLHEAQAALRDRGGAAARQHLSAFVDASGTDGGWLPAGRHPMGCRPGSAKWREQAELAVQQAGASEALRDERSRAQRFFHRAEEQRQTEHAKDAEHMRAHVHQAARAVERRRLHHASATYVHEPHAPAQGHAQEQARAYPAPSAAAAGSVVGYRPGSALARKAAGGLYAPAMGTDGHSQRLNSADEQRVLQQEVASQRSSAAKAAARWEEAKSIEAALAQREAQATVAMRSREFLAHAERIAQRKTINMAVNQPLAPPGRLHGPISRAPRSFGTGHMGAVS